MDGNSKDYVLQIRIKNAPMLRAMNAAGFNTASALSTACGVDQSRIGDYLNLKRTPINSKTQTWSQSVIKISKALKTLPEDMFPPQHLKKALERNMMSIEISANDVMSIIDWGIGGIDCHTPDEDIIEKDKLSALRRVLSSLTPREERILSLRYGLDGNGERALDQVGKSFSITTERVRQIECKALRKLQSPIKADVLKNAGWGTSQ